MAVTYKVVDAQSSPSTSVPSEQALNAQGQNGWALTTIQSDPQREHTRSVFTQSGGTPTYKVVDQPSSPNDPTGPETMLNTQGAAGWSLLAVHPDSYRERTRWIFGQGLGTGGGGGGTTVTPATWDPATATAVTLSGGNLVATSTGTTSADQGARVASAGGQTSGKYYFEATLNTVKYLGSCAIAVGTTASTYTSMGTNATGGVAQYWDGSIWANGSSAGIAFAAQSPGAVLQIAVDLDNRKWWSRPAGFNWNNSGTANPATNVGGVAIPAGTMVPFVTFGGSGGVTGNVMTANFGASAFTGAVPSGFTSGWSVPIVASGTPGTLLPLVNATPAVVGVSTAFSREDHVHPTDTSRAPLASPTFTGTPAAPTATAGTNTTQLATTAFATAADTATKAAIVGSASTGMDTLGEIENYIAANITPALGNKADTFSPTLTGDPKAPTPTAGDNDTSIATTAFVVTKTANYLPLAGGTLTGNLTISSAGALVVQSTVVSSSPTTGALTVAGGIGCGGLICGGFVVQGGGLPSTGAGVEIAYISGVGYIQCYDHAASAYKPLTLQGGVVKVADTTASTSPTTGALMVAGGLGVVGDAYVGGTIYGASAGLAGASPLVQINSTSGNGNYLNLLSHTAGINYLDTIGNLQVRTGPTAPASNVFLVDKNNGNVAFQATTASSSPSTGALTVGGGLGVTGAVTSGGEFWTGNGTSTGTIRFGASAGQYLYFNGSLFQLSGGPLQVSNATASSSSSTGALTVLGGAGFAGAIYGGGGINAAAAGAGGVIVSSIDTRGGGATIAMAANFNGLGAPGLYSVGTFPLQFGTNTVLTGYFHNNGSFVVGNPTGGANGGFGAINGQAVYDDGVVLTCFGTQHFKYGHVDLAQWDAVSPTGKHDLAHRFVEMLKEFDPRDPQQYVEQMLRTETLPGMPTPAEWQQNTLSLGQMHNRLWLAVELLASALAGTVQRVGTLEAALAQKAANATPA